jgi:hypothetical protein
MKKIFFAITAGAVLVLSACNNEEANNKLKEADTAAVQAAVDAKLAELQTSIDATCQATADSIATAQFDQWVAENSKGGKKPVASKPKPKPTEPKKEEPKKDGTVTDRKSTDPKDNKVTDRKSTETNTNQNKVTDRKSKPNN